MKKTTTWLIAVVALLALGACNTHNTLIKRHYTKGYYWSHSHKADDASASVNSSEPVKNKCNENRISESRAQVITLSEKNEPLAQAAPTQQVKHTKPIARLKKEDKKMYSLNPVLQKQDLTVFRKARSDSDALSLFWIVILVIVILWAVGFLAGGFGLGNLINLLLVVALILLILWLLKII